MRCCVSLTKILFFTNYAIQNNLLKTIYIAYGEVKGI